MPGAGGRGGGGAFLTENRLNGLITGDEAARGLLTNFRTQGQLYDVFKINYEIGPRYRALDRGREIQR